MNVLKKIDALSLAKVITVIYVLLGFFMGVLYYVMGLVSPTEALQASAILDIYSPWMMLIMPVAYAIAGFFGSLIIAGLYNIVAKKIGGVKLDLK